MASSYLEEETPKFYPRNCPEPPPELAVEVPVVVVEQLVTLKLHFLVEDGEFGQQLQLKLKNKSYVMKKETLFKLPLFSKIDVYSSKLN